MKHDRRDEIILDIRGQRQKAGNGPLAMTTPILKADTACETVDFYIREVRRLARDAFS